MNNQKIKCVVWDLDNTLWDGVLLEDEEVKPKSNIISIIKELDNRGILQSVSSKNEYEIARQKLIDLDLWEYFIYPQINWNSKSDGIREIAKNINIGTDTLAFIDDQPFEREEVNFSLPEVLSIDPVAADEILKMNRMMPNFITDDSKKRRQMYQNDIKRNGMEKQFTGTKEEFLRSLGMVFKISRAKEEDLQRAEELTIRTHQLNSTGYQYSYDELKGFIESDDYEVLVTQLDDKYGEYGKIGLALLKKDKQVWDLKLLLMSCRVMAKGIGNVMMNYIFNMAKTEGAVLRAQFIPTDRNRIMYITYKFNGFKEIGNNGNVTILEADMSHDRLLPDYVTVLEEG